MQAIELTAPRLIVIDDRGRTYSFEVARISPQQWMKYFSGIVSVSENQNGNRVDMFDSSSARTELVDAVLIDATGFNTGGKESITQIEDWQKKIPLRLRTTVGDALIDVTRTDAPENEDLALGMESIYLDAVWSAGDNGKMVKLHGLRHTFTTPTAEHQRRYRRDISRSKVIGGSRSGKTQWLGAQATLAALYDELIIGLEGYTVNGEPLAGRDEIAANMDTYHKVAAVEGLFETADLKLEE